MTTIAALHVDIDGTMARVSLDLPQVDPLAAVRAHLGPDCRAAELVALRRVDMWVDEEGLCCAEPQVNRVASVLAQFLGAHTPVIVGPALITGRTPTDDGPILASVPEPFFDTLGI